MGRYTTEDSNGELSLAEALALKAPLTGVATGGLWPISITGSAGSLSSNLSMNKINGGINANISTFLRGDGTWASGVAGVAGPAGIAGPQGPVGAKGNTGATGLTGAIGATGAVGSVGPQGIQGVQGPVGATGAVGPTGPQGPVGLAGTNGINGIQGPQGIAGPVSNVPGPQGIAGPVGAASTVAGPAGPSTYDIHNFINGKPLVNEILMRFASVRLYTCPLNFSGSIAYCTTPATLPSVIQILKNGVQIGTLTFNVSATTGVFTSISAITFNPSDQLVLRCTGAQDASLSDLSITILGTTS